MAGNVTKGHVKIDGQEYLIDERSYQVVETPDLAPRVSSGTPGYQDHLIFKNDAQSLWGGGYDFDFPDDFSNPTTFTDSRDIDPFQTVGEFKLSRRLDESSITLLESGAEYITNTQAGFDEGTYNQMASTDTPDIRLDFDSGGSTYTDKETFDGGGIDAEFTTSGDVDESGGFGRLNVDKGETAELKGTDTTIQGMKATSASVEGSTIAGDTDMWLGITDTNFGNSSGKSGNYIIFHWLNDVNDIEIITGGSEYGSFYRRLDLASGTMEIKEINGSQIEIYISGTLYHTVNSAVASGSFFKSRAYHNGSETKKLRFKFDTISYWGFSYYASGDWRSAQYTNTGSASDNIVELIVHHQDLSATDYIDKIELLDASDNSILSTYSANITTGASSQFTGLTADGWSTAWSDATFDGTDIKVKPYLVSAGDVTTPKISKLNVTFSATGSTQAVQGLVPWNSDLYLHGAKQLWKTSDGDTWTNQATAVSPILDAEPFEGRLFLAEGAYGYEYTATGSALTANVAASGFAADYFTANSSGASGRLYAVDSNKLAYSEDPEAAVPTWTTAFLHTGGSGETHFLGKPEIHNRIPYYTVNRGDTTNGPGEVWLYDRNNGTSLIVGKFESPISKKIKSFAGKLFFAVFEKTTLVIKAVDGGTIRTMKRINLNDAEFTNPIEWRVHDDKLNMIAESNSATAFQYQYDPKFDQGNGEGWARIRTLSNNNASGEYVMGVLDKEMYIGNDDGGVQKVSTSYATEGTLDSSKVDAGQFKIKKKYIELEVHHEALPTGTTITMQYKLDDDTAFTDAEGSGTVVNSTSFVARIPTSSNTGNALIWRAKLTSTGTDTPEVKDVITKYQIVEPFTKQWQFGVIVADSITYLNGTREQKNAQDLLNTLENTRLSTSTGTIDFYDIDDALHKVDYMRVGIDVPQIVGTPNEGNQDYIVGIQLIETQTTSS